MVRVIPDGQGEKVAIIKSFAPLVAPIRIGRSSPVDLDRLRQALADIKRRFDVVAAEAGDKLPAELANIRQQTAALMQRLKTVDRETAEPALTLSAGAALPRLRVEVLQPPAQPEPAHRVDPGRPRRSPAQVRRRGRALSPPDPPEGGHLGARGRPAVRRRAPDGRSRGHRRARDHVRGDPAHGARRICRARRSPSSWSAPSPPS